MGGGEREAARSLLELRASRYHHEFVKRAVVLSMDRKVAQQEAVSRLFQFLFKHEVRRCGYRCACLRSSQLQQLVLRLTAGEQVAVQNGLSEAVRGR